jgi:hypothetical protein
MRIRGQPHFGQEAALLQGDVGGVAENEMIEDSNAEEVGARAQLSGERDVARRGLGVSGRVVVQKNEARRARGERWSKDLAWIDRALVDAPRRDSDVMQEHVAAAQAEHVKRLSRGVDDAGPSPVDDALRGIESRSRVDGALDAIRELERRQEARGAGSREAERDECAEVSGAEAVEGWGIGRSRIEGWRIEG